MVVERSEDRVSILLPGGYRKSAAVWGAVLFGGWVAMLLASSALVTLSYVVGSDAADISVMLLMMPAGMLGFAVLGAYMALWALAGSERIVSTPDTLVLQRLLFGRPVVTREYDATHVERLRFSPTRYMREWNLWSAVLGCSVAFDYGAMTYRFGIGLPQDEAAAVVDAIQGASS